MWLFEIFIKRITTTTMTIKRPRKHSLNVPCEWTKRNETKTFLKMQNVKIPYFYFLLKCQHVTCYTTCSLSAIEEMANFAANRVKPGTHTTKGKRSTAKMHNKLNHWNNFVKTSATNLHRNWIENSRQSSTETEANGKRKKEKKEKKTDCRVHVVDGLHFSESRQNRVNSWAFRQK